jgi:hypothetical protein
MSAGVFARVAGSEMSSFEGKGVLLLGKVLSTSGEEAVVSSADGSNITILLAQDSEVNVNSWYQFKGMVSEPTRLTEYSHTNAGDGSVEIDLPGYIKLCQMWNGKHSAIFKPQ